VILGPLVSRYYRPAVQELCDPHGIEIAQLSWHNGRPILLQPRREGDAVAFSMDTVSFKAAKPPGLISKLSRRAVDAIHGVRHGPKRQG
jgi:hypothetical protein